MATGAVATGEGDVGTAVDGKAVVLVVDRGAADSDLLRRANVEGVGVVAAIGVAVLVIDGNIVDLKVGGVVDGEDLNRRVLDCKALDDGVVQLVGIEELRLGLATVGALGVPPAGSIAVKSGISAVNGDGITSDADERALPLLIAESRCALEDNLGALLEVAQVKSLASRNLDVVQGDCRARLLVLHGIGGTTGTAEGTAIGALVDRRRGSDDGGGGQRHRGEGRDEVHSGSRNLKVQTNDCEREKRVLVIIQTQKRGVQHVFIHTYERGIRPFGDY